MITATQRTLIQDALAALVRENPERAGEFQVCERYGAVIWWRPEDDPWGWMVYAVAVGEDKVLHCGDGDKYPRVHRSEVRL